MYYYSKRSRSKIVHQSTCQHIQNVSVEDVGSFENLEDAYAAGYRLYVNSTIVLFFVFSSKKG